MDFLTFTPPYRPNIRVQYHFSKSLHEGKGVAVAVLLLISLCILIDLSSPLSVAMHTPLQSPLAVMRSRQVLTGIRDFKTVALCHRMLICHNKNSNFIRIVKNQSLHVYSTIATQPHSVILIYSIMGPILQIQINMTNKISILGKEFED